jgi:hypothetical protein
MSLFFVSEKAKIEKREKKKVNAIIFFIIYNF